MHAPPIDSPVHLCRELLADRDWSAVETAWQRWITNPALTPALIAGDETYGLTDVSLLRYEGKDRRQTFAMRIGYTGSSYHGFQQQRGSAVRSVQDDLLDALGGRQVAAAGRTDRHVSALSQVVSLHTFDALTEASIAEAFAASEGSRAGRVRLLAVARVPRAFHALYGASWRRYVYMLPLSESEEQGGAALDPAFIARVFGHIEGRTLPFRAFHVKGSRDEAASDGGPCTMLRARASLCRIDTCAALCIELVGTRFLRHMVRALVVPHTRYSGR